MHGPCLALPQGIVHPILIIKDVNVRVMEGWRTLEVLWKVSECAFWVESMLYWRQKQHTLVWKLETQMEESIDETDWK